MRASLGVLLLCATAAADTVPRSRSPDGRHEVTWPDSDHAGEPNRVIERATGTPIATFANEPVFAGESHASPAPQWSRDGKTLVWYVEGKWGSLALEVLRIENGKVSSQLDVRERVVADVLAAVQRAAPRAAAIAKREGQGAGRWFREGLTIEVKPAWRGPLAYPLVFTVEVTSDPKCLDDYPAEGRLGYLATASLDRAGRLVTSPLRKRVANCGM